VSTDPWFHVFVEAPDGVDITGTVLSRAKKRLEAGGRSPNDVVYVHDFDKPSAPRPILLPAGLAPEFAQAMATFIESVREKLPTIDADQEVRAARTQLAKALKERQQSVVAELETVAKGLGFGIKSVPGGVQTFPIL